MPIAMPVVWLIAVVIFVISEAATMGLTSIWFACGALVAMIAALLGVGLWWQLALFAAGSAVLLATTRKWVGKLKHYAGEQRLGHYHWGVAVLEYPA